MTGVHDTATTLPWVRQGTVHLLAHVDQLTDDEFRAPSALPGWTRAHVVAHIARNAEALARLVAWARTGVETPMYASREQRAREIDQTATRPAHQLRLDAAATARALDDDLASLDRDQWSRTVRSALGRAIPVAEVPWMRIREVWLHAVDLDTGASVHDLPAGVVDLLAEDATATLSTKDECPAVVLAPTDRDRTWALGAARAGAAQPGSRYPVLRAPAATIVGWITGRVAAAELPAPVPPLPKWL